MNRTKTTLHRMIALALSVCMMLTMTPISVGAEDETCSHVCGETCAYTAGLPCTFTHEHDGECGYDAEAVDCDHEHDENCGGLSLGDSDNQAPAPVVITGFDQEPYHNPDDPGAIHIAVDMGTPEGDIPLPMTLNATIDGGEEYAYSVAVALWECTQKTNEIFEYVPGGYDPDLSGVYVFTPTLALGANESLAEGVTPPAIEVVVLPESAPAPAPMANGSYTIDNTSTIESHRINIQNLLNAAGPGNSVTVTGSRTDMGVRLALDIPNNVTLIWQASLSGDTTSYVPILSISGAGSFRMESGSLQNDEEIGYTLISAVTGGALITGSARITSTGRLSSAINQNSAGTLTINGSAQVTSTGATGVAISTAGNLTVGGSAQVNAAYAAITNSGSGTIKVGDSSSVTGGAQAINSLGNVEVSGGTVTGTGNSTFAILSTANVTVSGSGTIVCTTGNNSEAILISNGVAAAVDIQGGTVSSNGTTISTTGSSTVKVDVTISGGTVSSANNYAIYNGSSAGKVTVSGGEVTGAGAHTIDMQNPSNTAENVVVSGTGKVRNTGVGNAIRSDGGVRVAGNALVAATAGNAIYSKNATIVGGAVFAYGTAITGSANVIRTTTGTYTAPTGNGIAIAWDNAVGVTNYAQGSKLHITAQPQDKAYWSGIGGTGIQYENGSASGLIPLVVTIGVGNIPPAATSVGIDAGTHDFPAVGVPIAGDYTYNSGSGTGGGGQSGSTYKWYRGTSSNWSAASEISGETNVTYTPTSDDIGKYLFFEVTPSNGSVTGDAVHSVASAQAGVMVNLVVVQNGTNGTARIAGVSGPTSYKVVSATSPALGATLGNALGVAWMVSTGGGTFTNDTAVSPGYSLPSLSSITGPITITATFTKDDQPPQLTAVSVDGATNQSAVLHFTSNKTGTYYYLVYADSVPAPSIATIKAQGAANPTPVAYGTSAFGSANYPYSIAISGLTATTAYKVHLVVTDAAGGDSLVSTVSFTTVSLQTYGLVFDVSTGKMTCNDTDYSGQSWSWNSGTQTLILTNFNWVTSAPTALQIKGGAITLDITGSNSFISTFDGVADTFGIYVSDGTRDDMYPITIKGSGTLEATGGKTTGTVITDNSSNGCSYGIRAQALTLNGGTLNAIGGSAYRSYGIGLLNFNFLTITGGELTARGSGPSGDAFRGSSLTLTLPAKYNYLGNTSNTVPPLTQMVTVPGGTPLTYSMLVNYKYAWIQTIPPSPEKGLTSVAGQDVSSLAQTGTSGSPMADTVNVASGVATLALADIVVSTDASLGLYRNSGFSTEVTGSDTIALTSGGATTVYIKVTAEDTSEAYYAITVNRAQDAVIDILTIDGVTPPAYGGTPVTAITATAQYTGTVTWSPAHNPFRAGTAYTATITLTPKPGYTLTDVESDSFDVFGAADVRNAANSGGVTAYFSPTAAPTIAVTHTGLTGLKVGESGVGTVLYTLSNGVYANTIVGANFEVTGLPAGLSQSVTRTNDTVVTVTVTGTPAAANASSVNLGIPFSIPAANVQGATAAIMPTGTVTASVAKGDGLIATGHNISIVSTDTAQHDFDLDNIALNKMNSGNRSYTLDAFAGTTTVLTGVPTLLGSTLSYTGNSKTSGSATQVITITTDNYADTMVTITFTATVKTDVGSQITFGNGSATYTGVEQVYENATFGGTKNNPIGDGFTYSYTAGTGTVGGTGKPLSAGTYTVTATYEDDTQKGSQNATFTLNPKNITSGVTVAANFPVTTFNGSAQSPSPTSVTFDTLPVTITTDYTLGTYSNNTNAGTTASVVINGMGNYTGSKTVNFTIARKDITSAAVVASFLATTYNGSAQTPSPTSVTFDGTGVTITTDYTLSGWSNNTNAGTNTASVVINGAGNYMGTKTVNFTIGPKSLALNADNKTILVNDPEPTYTYTVTGLVGGDTAAAVITAQPSMSVMGFNSSSATTFTITITGGATTDTNYTISTRTNGTLTVTTKTPITIGGLTSADGTYNGQGHRGVTGTATSGLYTGTLDYSYSGGGIIGSTTTQPIDAGSYILTVSVPASNLTYAGSQTYNFTIQKRNLTVRPKSYSMTVGGSLPTFELEYSGIVSGETITPNVPPAFSCTGNGLATGSFPITWTNEAGTSFTDGTGKVANYNVTKQATGTLTVTAQTYTLTVNAGTGGTVSGGGSGYTAGQVVNISAGASSGYSFSGWSSNKSGTFGNASSASTTFTMPAANVTVTASFTYTGSSSGSSGGGGGGGGLSGWISSLLTPPEEWLEQNPAGTLASDANGKKQDYVRTRHTGIYGVRAAAWAKLAGLKYEHDTVADGAVQVRVYINDPAKLTKDTLVSGYVKGSEVDKIKSHFEKWFKNKLRTIHLDQQGSWGQPVGVAAKIDLTGMDTTKLYFYAYDKASNSYWRIEKPAYWIDDNGYLHFTTEYAGDIIISDGPLERKGQNTK